jgi:putative methylase
VKNPRSLHRALRQKELEIRLEAIPPPPRPSPSLEQYRTPPKIAADLLYRALARGDLVDKRVLDLGCGTGMFTLGALLLGARESHGIDVDAASIEVAIATAERLELPAIFEVRDVGAASGTFDVVLMNPPFGAQFGARHLDTVFVETALNLAPIVYSLHLAENAAHFERVAVRLGVQWEQLARYDFPLPAQFKFHTKEKHVVPVVLYRFERP